MSAADDPPAMDPATARVILEGLQAGVNPFTGEPLTPDAPCQDPDVQAALALALRLLDDRPAAKPKPKKTDPAPQDELTLF